MSIFVQIGQDVKKAKLESMPTLQELKIIFIERFQYNPNVASFPSIYVRDGQFGVHYELEDMSDIKNGSVISLNVDCKQAKTTLIM